MLSWQSAAVNPPTDRGHGGDLGDVSDKDEVGALAGIQAAGLTGDAGA